jgi:hypothetical protein
MIPNRNFCESAHEHQKELFNAFDRRRISKIDAPQIFMCEWHRRCRKTTAAINLNIREACRFPGGKYGHIAPTQVMARNIIWDDPNMLRSYLPDKREMNWRLNEQKMLVSFKNGSLIKFGGADEPDSWRGTDFVGVTCDEWSMIKEQLWIEILRPVIGGPLPKNIRKYQPFRWALFLYTPLGLNHASIMFDDCCCLADGGTLPDLGAAEKLKPNTYASRVDGERSGIYSDDELRRMKAEMPPAIYDQEIKCRRVTSEEMTLITSEMLMSLNDFHKSNTDFSHDSYKIVSVDPAFGGDVCRMMAMENCRVIDNERIRDKHNTGDIVLAAKMLAKKINTKNFIVDSIGSGLGVADGLAADEAKYYVQYFNSSEKPNIKTDTFQSVQFANRRAEAYWVAAERVRRFEVGPVNSQELLIQLPIASRYFQTGGGKMQIRPKEKIKEELGRSPDDADCWVMGVWGTQYIANDTVPKDRIGLRHQDKRPKSPMVMG